MLVPECGTQHTCHPRVYKLAVSVLCIIQGLCCSCLDQSTFGCGNWRFNTPEHIVSHWTGVVSTFKKSLIFTKPKPSLTMWQLVKSASGIALRHKFQERVGNSLCRKGCRNRKLNFANSHAVQVCSLHVASKDASGHSRIGVGGVLRVGKCIRSTQRKPTLHMNFSG